MNGKAKVMRKPIYNLLVVTATYGAGLRICYQIPFKILYEEGSVFYRIVRESELKITDIENVDRLILYRCIRGETLSLARLARRREIPVIYELDDDLLDPPTSEPWGSRYIRNGLPMLIQLFLEAASLIKAGSPELARRIEDKGFPVIYFPYPVQLRPLFQKNRPEPPYRIGYFGTPHHQKDISMIFGALKSIEDQLGDKVEFEFLGCVPQSWTIFKKACFLRFNLDYEKFLDDLTEREWSIGLAPLQPTRFNGAKSDGKFRDFTAAGIPGIYADWEPYRDCVKHGVTGWLCGPDPAEWLRVIGQVLREEKQHQVLMAARDLVRRDHDPVAAAHKWRLILENASGAGI